MVKDGLNKRHFDIRLDVGTLAAGGQRLVTIKTPIDAPFVLKSRAARCQYQPTVPPSDVERSSTFAPGQSLMNNLAWKFAGPDEGYYSQDLVPWGLEAPNQFGQTPNGLWLPNSIVYPPGSTIEAYVMNIGTDDIPGLELYYRGYQLFTCNQVPDLTYPGSMETNDFNIVTGPGTPLIPTIWSGALTPLLQVTDNQLLLQLRAPKDSDFVLRTAGAVSPSNIATPGGSPYPLQVYCQLRDWNEKAYSNLPIHVDVLFGQFPKFIDTASQLQNPGTPGYQAGLFTPEIYLPKNQYLFYDLSRADQYLADDFGLTPVAESYVIAWRGAKVYAR